MRLLFLYSNSHAAVSDPQASSDSIGYGITSATALVCALRELGVEVDELVTVRPANPTSWTGLVLQEFASALRCARYDVVFVFHASSPMSSSVRQLMNAAGVSARLVGYTHGSHWDPTDLFRQSRDPHLRWADLGNLLSLDVIFVVSEFLRSVLVGSVFEASKEAGREIERKLRVVGLPIDCEGLDRAKASDEIRGEGGPRLLFNHSFTDGKRPEQFLRLAGRLLDRVADLRIDISRAPVAGTHAAQMLAELAAAHPGRVCSHGGLDIPSYFTLLRSTTHQVSTASHETFGVATLEAMYAENCCIVPDHAVYPEILKTVPEARFKPGQDFDLCLALLTSPARSRTIALRQRQVARQVAIPQQVAARILEAV
jgi:glycosyltransferase involved in cell wall biosynthesis